MSDKQETTQAAPATRIPLDVWAVLLALTLAAVGCQELGERRGVGRNGTVA